MGSVSGRETTYCRSFGYVARRVICASVLLLAACVQGLALPIGGPKERVPPEQVQRNIETVSSFFNVSMPAAFRKAVGELVLGQILTVPTDVPEWTDDVKGQILPFGQYQGVAKSAEYWFLMPILTTWRASFLFGLNPLAAFLGGTPSFLVNNQHFRYLYGEGNMVHVRREADIFQTTPKGEVRSTFVTDGTFFLNREGKICGYDMAARHNDAFFVGIGDPLRSDGFPSDVVKALFPPGVPARDAYLPKLGTDSWIREICDVALGPICQAVGEVHYDSMPQCLDALREKRRGEYSNLDEDTRTCRALHRMLVPSNPKMHCRHLAANLTEAEGAICVDRNTDAYTSRNFQCGYDDVGYVSYADNS